MYTILENNNNSNNFLLLKSDLNYDIFKCNNKINVTYCNKIKLWRDDSKQYNIWAPNVKIFTP